MSRSKREFRALFLFSCVACSDAMSEPGELQSSARRSFNLTANERLAACAQDPRVVAGLVSAQVCAGADIFFNETFDGNGRTCGSCHPANNNTTLDVPFVQELHAINPDDPLFINENDPNLAQLETMDLVLEAAILENVDEFSDPTRRFVSRGVNHVLSLRTSISADTGDGTTNPPVERAGWGGDGSDDGSLRGFLEGCPAALHARPAASSRHRLPRTDGPRGGARRNVPAQLGPAERARPTASQPLRRRGQ
jgi:hypothetical protein